VTCTNSARISPAIDCFRCKAEAIDLSKHFGNYFPGRAHKGDSIRWGGPDGEHPIQRPVALKKEFDAKSEKLFE
jgi:hypothetical protein